MTIKTVFITTTGAGTFTVPGDFYSVVSVEAIGGGGGSLRFGGAPGSGGGAYAKSISVAGLVANGTAYYSVGAGGSPGNPPTSGGDTWFNTATNAAPTVSSTGVLAKGGIAPTTSNSPGGLGGSAASSVGDTIFAGGNGGAGQSIRGGGGGAAGPGGAGGAGGASDNSVTASGGGGGGGASLTNPGSASGAASGTQGGTGGNDGTGSGGGAGATATTTSVAGSRGGGGGGGFGSTAPYTGGANGGGTEVVWTASTGATAGSGGGGGGAAAGTGTNGGSGGLYGGGAGGSSSTGAGTITGAQGIIVFTYIANQLVTIGGGNTVGQGVIIGTAPTYTPLVGSSTWTAQAISPGANYWSNVSYGNNTFLALATPYTTRNNSVSTSTNGGVTWTTYANAVPWDTTSNANTSPAYNRPVAYGNNIWVFALNQGTGKTGVTSTDGITWTTATNALSTASVWYGVIFDGTKFVMYSDGQNLQTGNNAGTPWFQTSTNGTTWSYTYQSTSTYVGYSPDTSPVTSPYSQYDLAYGNGTYVSVGRGVAGFTAGPISYAYWSTDLVSWNKVRLPVSGQWSQVVYGGGIFVAVDTLTASGFQAVRSLDSGRTWQQIPVPGTQYACIAYGGGQWVILPSVSSIAAGWTTAAYSTDAWNWRPITLPTFSGSTIAYNDITYGNGKFVAISRSVPAGNLQIVISN